MSAFKPPSAAAAATAENEVVINGLADLPAPSGGVIQLEDNLIYVFAVSITTSDRFQLGANNVITSNNTLFPLLTYTGTGNMFTGVDVNVTFRSIFILSCFVKFFLFDFILFIQHNNIQHFGFFIGERKSRR